MKDFEMGDCPVSANLRLPFIGTSANGRHCTVSCDQVVTALISDGFTVLGRGPKSLIYQRVSGRSGRIRTSGPCLPKTVLYQAELHSAVIPSCFGDDWRARSRTVWFRQARGLGTTVKGTRASGL